MSDTYLFTLEIDVLDAMKLVGYARNLATNCGLSEDEVAKTIASPADALQWIFDDNSRLEDAGFPAEIVASSCEPLNGGEG